MARVASAATRAAISTSLSSLAVVLAAPRAFESAARLWSDLVESIAAPGLDPDNPANRDTAFIASVLPLLDSITTPYFRPEFEGEENVPRSGPFIAVGNHNGGPMLPDLWTMLVYWFRTVGMNPPVHVLAHDAAFQVKIAGNFFARLGALRASRANAEKVLRSGGGLLVYPGGELDCFRSYWRRNRVDLRGRTGFIELAFESGAPIVPFVNVGGHEVYVTLLSSRRLARISGIEALTGVKTLPINLGLPWGVWATGFVPFLPLPARLQYRVGSPIHVPHDPDLARDRRAVLRIYRQVVESMQQMVDELVARRRFPIVG